MLYVARGCDFIAARKGMRRRCVEGWGNGKCALCSRFLQGFLQNLGKLSNGREALLWLFRQGTL
ncbi:hypothetical protein KSC_028440 [Ktedonobacter sp. SOSP1-52]|nr:hypothetical protein KSC_028440 [Ktedonobacter sp. SOSP1-52]